MSARKQSRPNSNPHRAQHPLSLLAQHLMWATQYRAWRSSHPSLADLLTGAEQRRQTKRRCDREHTSCERDQEERQPIAEGGGCGHGGQHGVHVMTESA